MKKKKLILWTCLISILILILLFLGLFRLSKEKTYPVFLLDQDVSSGCKIEKDMIRSIFIPQSCIFPTICKKEEDIVGRILIRNMKDGDILSRQDLQILENTVPYPSVTQGHVLYTLALKPEDANGWWISKGNEINLLFYDAATVSMDSMPPNESIRETNLQGGTEEKNPIRQIESVKIVRIMDESGNETIQDGKPPKMICLELTNEQAKQLFQAENGKKIKLIAKNTTEIK